MKRYYSYFLIKPDGIRFLDDICKTIEENYKVRYYAIRDFSSIVKKLYHANFKTRGEEFRKSFEAYLYGLINLFGNQTILAMVSGESQTYEQFVKGVYNTKIKIRDKHVNDNIGIVTNYGEVEENKIQLISRDGKTTSPRILKGFGHHRINNINIIHCPDADIRTTIDELNILEKQGIISDGNMITDKMMQDMKRYTTTNFQNDMYTEEYQGAIQPDISGFIKSRIDEDSERYL